MRQAGDFRTSSLRRRWLARLCLALAGMLVSAEALPAHARHPDAAATEAAAVALAEGGQRDAADKLFRRVLQLDLAWLGAEHPDAALNYSNYAANLLAEGKGIEAEQLATKAVHIVRAQRAAALQVGDEPGAALLRAKAHLNHADPFGFVFERYLDAAWARARATSGNDEHLRSKAFMAAQDLVGSATAHAMAMATARTAAKGGSLGAILQEQQRLTGAVSLLTVGLQRPAPATTLAWTPGCGNSSMPTCCALPGSTGSSTSTSPSIAT